MKVYGSLNIGTPEARVTVNNFKFGNIIDDDIGTPILPSKFSGLTAHLPEY